MNLARILDNLTRRIPALRKPAPKPQLSFAGLKLGQRLAARDRHYVGELDTLLSVGAEWEVVSVTDQGVVAQLVSTPDVKIRLDRNWRDGFANAPKPRKQQAAS